MFYLLMQIYAQEFLKNTMQYSQSAGKLDEKKNDVIVLFDKVCYCTMIQKIF